MVYYILQDMITLFSFFSTPVFVFLLFRLIYRFPLDFFVYYYYNKFLSCKKQYFGGGSHAFYQKALIGGYGL